MLKEIETLDKTLKVWKQYGGNQFKLVIISKIWSRYWVNRDLGFVANWSTHLCTYPPMLTPWIISTFNFENFTKYLQGPLRAIFNQGLNCSCSWIFNMDLHHFSDQHLKWMQVDYIDLWRSTSLFNSLLCISIFFVGICFWK